MSCTRARAGLVYALWRSESGERRYDMHAACTATQHYPRLQHAQQHDPHTSHDSSHPPSIPFPFSLYTGTIAGAAYYEDVADGIQYAPAAADRSVQAAVSTTTAGACSSTRSLEQHSTAAAAARQQLEQLPAAAAASWAGAATGE